MTPKLLCAAVVLFGTTFAADSSRILLMGKSISPDHDRVSGNASAVVGDMRVSSESITFDQRANALRCEGGVSIKVGADVVSTKACVIKLGTARVTVLFLNPKGVQVWPNQTLEPTATAVTPPASQEPRHP